MKPERVRPREVQRHDRQIVAACEADCCRHPFRIGKPPVRAFAREPPGRKDHDRPACLDRFARHFQRQPRPLSRAFVLGPLDGDELIDESGANTVGVGIRVDHQVRPHLAQRFIDRDAVRDAGWVIAQEDERSLARGLVQPSGGNLKFQ